MRVFYFVLMNAHVATTLYALDRQTVGALRLKAAVSDLFRLVAYR